MEVTSTLGGGTWWGVHSAMNHGLRHSIWSNVRSKYVRQALSTSDLAVGSHRIKWSWRVQRNAGCEPWFTGIGSIWKAWKISFLIQVYSSWQSGGDSMMFWSCANAWELASSSRGAATWLLLSISLHFLRTLKVSEWKSLNNIKYDLPFCMEFAAEYASSMCSRIESSSGSGRKLVPLLGSGISWIESTEISVNSVGKVHGKFAVEDLGIYSISGWIQDNQHLRQY